MNWRRNPDLLIINPSVMSRDEVWERLISVYPPHEALEAFKEMYPGTKIKQNGDVESFGHGDNPDFKRALKLFRKFHGRDPDEITEVDMGELGPAGDGDVFLVALGETPIETYIADNVVEGSSKGHFLYYHPYESPIGQKPIKAVTSDGKRIVTLDGDYKVTDFIRG